MSNYFTMKDLIERLNVSRATIYRWMYSEKTQFPKSIKLGYGPSSTVKWLRSEVLDWEAKSAGEHRLQHILQSVDIETDARPVNLNELVRPLNDDLQKIQNDSVLIRQVFFAHLDQERKLIKLERERMKIREDTLNKLCALIGG